MLAKDVMIRSIYTIKPIKRIALARLRMLRHGVGALPVVDDTNLLVGIITLRDIDLAGDQTYELNVNDLMTTALVTCSKDTPIDEIVEIMLNTGLQRIPVTDNNGMLLGLITQTVVIKAVKDSLTR